MRHILIVLVPLGVLTVIIYKTEPDRDILMAHHHHHDAAGVCREVLGPNIIMMFDERLINLRAVRGIWCYIEMRTPSSGKTVHHLEEERRDQFVPNYTENTFETLDELQKNILRIYSM